MPLLSNLTAVVLLLIAHCGSRAEGSRWGPFKVCPSCKDPLGAGRPPRDHNLAGSTTVLAQGEPCGVYTLSCAKGLRCVPPPREHSPLQALLQGRGICAKHIRTSPTERPHPTGKIQAPCRKLLNSVLRGLELTIFQSDRDIYIPNCDTRGFYRKKQRRQLERSELRRVNFGCHSQRRVKEPFNHQEEEDASPPAALRALSAGDERTRSAAMAALGNSGTTTSSPMVVLAPKTKTKKKHFVQQKVKVFRASEPIVSVFIWGVNHSVFRNLRERFGVEDLDFQVSLTRSPPVRIADDQGEGLLLNSYDRTLVVKQISSEDVADMHNILSDYHQHIVKCHGSTLLPQFLGMYRVSVDSEEAYLIVMRNMFSHRLVVHRKYDLKVRRNCINWRTLAQTGS
ncbi:hypothetical protein GOODEAATRI_004766 [Goodea atripinnis]|uniref:PIPK domain-containing protein n=1 Tax=Goodea atripinnis TaxID=208336 RepID=A0ABV0N088_9TELE